MKNYVIGLIAFAGTLCAYDYDCATCYLGKGYWYAQLGGSAIGIGSGTSGGVNVGFGWRYINCPSGVDISIFFQEGSDHGYSVAYPRLRYLHYLTPRMYVGGGLSFCSARAKDKKFRGLATEFVIGTNLPTDERVHRFVELAVSQPTIKSTNHKRIIGPSVALSFGIGF